MEEEWRGVVGFESLYEVSNLGGFRRVSDGFQPRQVDTHGYRGVNIWEGGRVRGTQHHFRIHREVAKAFIPNPLCKPYTNHKDGVKHNNRVDNLEWCTQSENIQHAWDTGLCTRVVGEEHPHAKVKDEVIVNYMKDRKGLSIRAFARSIGVTHPTIIRRMKQLSAPEV